MPQKTLAAQLLKSMTPRLYTLLRLGLKNEKLLTNSSEAVEQFTRKILEHDIPSLKLTAAKNQLVSLSAPLLGLKYAILVYHKQLIQHQWENYQATPSDYNVMINPSILKHSKETETKEEECPVLPALYFTVERPVAIEVEYQDDQQVKHFEQFFGFEARVIQHEIDHLHGTLPSHLSVCRGICRSKYNFVESDRIEKEYEELCSEEVKKLEELYQNDKKFKVQVDKQSSKGEYFLRIVLGDNKFEEYLRRKGEAFRMDIANGKLQRNN